MRGRKRRQAGSRSFGRRHILHAVFLALVLLGLTMWSRGGRYVLPERTEPLDESHARRVLVLAPHCDDEVLATGGLISDSINAGKQVRVVIVTNGDGFKWAEKLYSRRLITSAADMVKFGYERQGESIEALRILGVPRDDILFLGYPDRGLEKMWFANWSPDHLYKSPYTKTDHSPYVNSYTLKAPYCGASFVKDLLRIIRDFAPDQIFLPHPNDAHPDHWATFAFAQVALRMLSEEDPKFHRAQVKTYLVHRGGYPLPKKINARLPLMPPDDLEINGADWQLCPLSPGAVAAKRQAILAFKSQTEVKKRFLLRFARANEIFCVEPPAHVISLALDREPVIDRDDFLGKIAPTVTDPVGDDLSRRVERGADFTSLFAFATPQNLDITTSVAGKVSPNVKYLIDLWLFPPEHLSGGALLATPPGQALGTTADPKVYRVVVDIRKRRIWSATLTKVSLNGAPPTDISKDVMTFYSGKNLSVILARRVLPQDTLGFIGAFTYLRNRVFIDKTAYRIIQLPPPDRASRQD